MVRNDLLMAEEVKRLILRLVMNTPALNTVVHEDVMNSSTAIILSGVRLFIVV